MLVRHGIRLALAISAALCAQQVAAQTPAASAASMPPALVRQIQEFAAAEHVSGGLLEAKGGVTHVFITSARTLIASRTREVQGDGGTYRPTAAARLDVVSVSCGSTELGELFHCGRVSVRSASGAVVRPVAYRAGPEVVRNAMGATWSARTVFATYPVRALREGFVVTYSDTDGAEWQIEVTDAQAREELLLQMPEVPPLTTAQKREAAAELERQAEARRAEELRAAAEKYAREAPERERKRLEAERAAEAARIAAAEKAAADAEAKRAAFAEACRVAAEGDRGNLRGCVPAPEVCASAMRQKIAFNGCPHVPLWFQGGTLPRATRPANMVIACNGSQLVATVYPQLKLKAGVSHQVRVKWGDTGQPASESWILGPNREFINAPDPSGFAAQMGKHYYFAIEVTPDGHPPYATHFNIGADPDRTDVKYLLELCGKTSSAQETRP